MQALILAGGFGTRLRNLVQDRPKPMANINGKPFLEYQINYLKRCGIDEILLCVSYLGEYIRDYFGDGKRIDVKIDYSYEVEPLGTAGAIKNAAELLEDNFIVLNGDTYYECDYSKLIEFHRYKNASFTMSVVKRDDNKDCGTIVLNADSILQSFSEEYETSPKFVNSGVYVMNRSVLRFIPDRKRYSLEAELIPKLINNRISIYGCVDELGMFIDIGVPERYLYFQEYAKEENV